MGGNGSYSKSYRGVPDASRTHVDTHMRIDGHKILLQSGNVGQSKNIMNSNSESPIYIIAYAKKNGEIKIHSINVFEDYGISLEINLKYDDRGEIIPYSANSEKGSHSHRWFVNEEGEFARKQHDDSNAFDIPPAYNDLIKHIVEFNKQKRRWTE